MSLLGNPQDIPKNTPCGNSSSGPGPLDHQGLFSIGCRIDLDQGVCSADPAKRTFLRNGGKLHPKGTFLLLQISGQFTYISQYMSPGDRIQEVFEM